MKIKTKKTMNLPQLIERGFKNDIKNKSYKTNDTEGYELYFDEYGTPRFSNIVNKNDTFTVEVEEEITEDTKFKHLIEIEQDDTCYMWLNTSVSAEKQVNDCKNLSKEFHAYIDGEFKLIWTREKGLVE